MSYESFQFSVIEYSEELTSQTHSTLAWLVNNDYITAAEYHDLVGRLIVTPIRNKPQWGKSILNRFFSNSKKDEVTYVFPLILLDPQVQVEYDGTDSDSTTSDNVVNINSVPKKDR